MLLLSSLQLWDCCAAATSSWALIGGEYVMIFRAIRRLFCLFRLSSRMESETIKADAKKKMTPEQYDICFNRGTEPAFTGKYWNHKASGEYLCAACGVRLFNSSTKFDSGTGWPSFWAVADANSIREEKDRSHSMVRKEVKCRRCGSHLGHLFDDGPAPSGLRYCINSASLDFKPREG